MRKINAASLAPITLLLFCILPVPCSAAQLSEADLENLIELKIDDGAIIKKIREDGVAFEVNEKIIERLRSAGASDAVLDALTKSAKPPADAIEYADVLRLVELGIDETAILERLARSPTLFVLDSNQETELRDAGASDRLLAALKGARPQPPEKVEVTDIALILDCSGSMKEHTTDGKPKMAVARDVVSDLIGKIPNGLGLTFVIYGHDAELKCEAVEVVRSLADLDANGKSTLRSQIAGLRPVSSTPIAMALRTTGKELADSSGQCGLVLISDGKETCDGDPVAEVAALREQLDLAFGAHVIGFDVDEEGRTQLEEIAHAGGGKYYNAQTASDLAESVAAFKTELDEAVEPAPTTVIRRRAVKIQKPRVKFPAIKEIVVVEAGDWLPDAFNYDPVIAGKDYGDEIRLPSTDEYDVLWVPEEGKAVRMVTEFAVNERKLAEFEPEDHLGMVRVGGEGLPQPKLVALTEVDGYGPDAFNFDPVQLATKYGVDMVAPIGKYDLWIQLPDGSAEKLEAALEIQGGRVTALP